MKNIACENVGTVHTHTHTRINLIDKKRVANISYSKNDMINRLLFNVN